MQPRGKSPSLQPIVSTRPTYRSQKDVKTNEETTDTFPSSTTSEIEKSEGETPPINPIYPSSSASTTLAPPNSVIPPHYYPAPAHHHVIYPHHIPPSTSDVLHPIQP